MKSNRMAKLSASREQATAAAVATIKPLVESRSANERFAAAEKLLHAEAEPAPVSSEELIDIHLVEDNPYNARAFYDQSIINDRANSILKEGQLEAVKVALHPFSGKLTLIDGQYRKRALLALNRGQILVKHLKATTIEDFFRLSFAANNERADQTAMDNAVVWSKMLQEKVYATEDELARAINVSPATVNKVLSIMSLPEDLVTMMRESPRKIEWSVAYELVLFYRQCKDPVLTEEMIQHVIKDEFSKRDIESARKELSTVKPERVHRMSRQYKVKDIPGITGNLKDWDDGRLMLDLRISDLEVKQKILKIIKDELKIQ